MKLDEFRDEMLSYWQTINADATSFKDSGLVSEKHYALYRKFDKDERKMANQVLSEWVLSKDEALRFSALMLVEEFKVTEAKTSLTKLVTRLSSSETPGAPFELIKVNRILKALLSKFRYNRI